MSSPDLDAAYHATAYVVEMPGGKRISLRCGEPSADLDRHLQDLGVVEWAFVTACNPRSKRLDDAVNALRMARLDEVLRDRGLPSLTGSGVPDAAEWPPEPSRLVLGIGEADAIALGRLFDQNAILVGVRGHAARLVWIAYHPTGEGCVTGA